MIQALLQKPVDTQKAQQVKAGAEVSIMNGVDASLLEAMDAVNVEEFSKELEAKIKDADVEVKPVQISKEQELELPSTLVQPGSVDASNPKVFDPALTKGVEKLIQPKTSEVAVPAMTEGEVVEIAKAKVPELPLKEMKGELAQALTKNQGRAPAIEFAKSEIDPQLLNNEDFVTQKNLFSKKIVSDAYGMKTIPVHNSEKLALESGLKPVEVVQETGSVESIPMNAQQFILGLQTEQQSLPVNETQAASKVFDMTHIKSGDVNEVMNQITDYVIQARAAKEPTVNVRVKHDDLGMIDITVSKTGAQHDAIAINIGTHSADGKNFFQQNTKDLVTHLTSAGLNVSELKVETPAQTAKSDFDFGSQHRQGQQGSERQFGSEQNQRRHESERRQDLWKLLNKEAA